MSGEDTAETVRSLDRPVAPPAAAIAYTELHKAAILQYSLEELSPQEQPRSRNGYRGRRWIFDRRPDRTYMYQARTYGNVPAFSSKEAHRVYLQVETVDIPGAVEMLKEIGTARARKQDGLDFKVLLAIARNEDLSEMQVGEYEGLNDGDPRIVVYLSSEEERLRFTRELQTNRKHLERIREMSKRRRNPDGSWKARREGAHVVYDMDTGEELRAVNYTEGGYSEDVVKRYGVDNWRQHVRGLATGKIPQPSG